MPFRFYYGKTGRVWNVTKRAIGVELFKTVGNRKRTKKIHVRIEHVRHSKCRIEHKQRVIENEIQKSKFRNEKIDGKKVEWKCLKRSAESPKNGYLI